MATIQEGYLPFKGYRTYYRIVGECTDGKKPLLALHGGPGAAHDYLESLDALAENGRQVIYYDAIGCGKSVTPIMGEDFWSAELFEEELVMVREALGLDDIHLLGQSWGGMLAMQYATHLPKGIRSMIVASSPSSIPAYLEELATLRSWLPEDMAQALIQADVDGDYERPEVVAASDEFYRRHVIGIPAPDYVARSLSQMGEQYMVMQGASEFVVTGKLKDWDITDDLQKITIPTLLTSGSCDEMTPYMVKMVYDRIPNCKWELFQGGTHLCHVELQEKYNEVIEEFMASHDK